MLFLKDEYRVARDFVLPTSWALFDPKMLTA